MYIIDPGNEIFIPNNLWSKPPAHQRLGKDLAYADMKLTKQTDVIQENCNNTNGYVYGGKKFQIRSKIHPDVNINFLLDVKTNSQRKK